MLHCQRVRRRRDLNPHCPFPQGPLKERLHGLFNLYNRERRTRIAWTQKIASRSKYLLISFTNVFEQPLTKKALPGKIFPSLALVRKNSQIIHPQETQNIVRIPNGYIVGFYVQSYWNESCILLSPNSSNRRYERTTFFIIVGIKECIF